jgi:hypothetical protein
VPSQVHVVAPAGRLRSRRPTTRSRPLPTSGSTDGSRPRPPVVCLCVGFRVNEHRPERSPDERSRLWYMPDAELRVGAFVLAVCAALLPSPVTGVRLGPGLTGLVRERE